MKLKKLFPPLCFALFSLTTSLFSQNAPIILPTDNPEAGPPMRVIWPTEPGIRYILEQSTDLEVWTTVDGFPSEAEALAHQHAFEMESDRRFFRVIELDEQPPKAINKTPGKNSFGIGRFSVVSVQLEDRTGIDPDSISFSIGGGNPITLSDTALSFENGVLTYDLGGDSALGGYGELIELEVEVSDQLGNSATYTWNFELEREIEVAENLFVFGSPDAQRAGQRLSGPAARVAARFGGPLRMSGSTTEWDIDHVTEDTVVVAYTSVDAPVFTVGQKITNLAPAHVDHIFYREVLSVSTDEGAKTVTLTTDERELANFIVDGSFSIDNGDVILEFDESGTLIAMRSFSFEIDLPTIGADFSGSTIYSGGPLTISLPEARALFYPSLYSSMDFRFSQLERFEVRAGGDFDLAVVPQISLSGSYSGNISQELWRSGFWIWTTAGFVPVGIDVSASITANAGLNVSSSATLTTGFRQTAAMGVSGVFDRNLTPAVSWDRWFRINPTQIVPFSYSLDGQGSATVALVPQIDVRIYGTAGLYVNTDPRLELSGSASMTDGTITEASWMLGAYADVNAGLSVIGLSNNQLPALPPFRFFTREWGNNYSIDSGPGKPLAITRQPMSQNARVGDTVVFAVEAGGSGNLSYQWYHKGVPRPGATGRELRLKGITAGFAGDYFVRVRDANGLLDSSAATLTLVSGGSTGPVPASMVRVSGGTLAMSMGTRTVDTFYIGRYQVTWGEWQGVLAEAAAWGYDFGSRPSGCANDHPVHSVSWYDAVKWCNLKSELEGLTPVYTVDDDVYRSGSFGRDGSRVVHQNLTANGYRLPLEAEWEFAARGGNQTNGYTYAGSNNLGEVGWYSVNSGEAACNFSNGRGTWPVGQKLPNELGLYDMSGNVREWCWDRVTANNYPRIRGGYYSSSSTNCRVSHRSSAFPHSGNNSQGFRIARSSGN